MDQFDTAAAVIVISNCKDVIRTRFAPAGKKLNKFQQQVVDVVVVAAPKGN